MTHELSISLEGLDGSGKSTVAPKVGAHYRELGYRVAELTSPSKSPTGLYVRQHMFEFSPEEKEKAFADDLRASQEGIPGDTEIAVWDRHIDSIYSSNKETTLAGVAILASGLRLPDMTFYLQLSAQEAYERALPITDHPLDLDWLIQKRDRYEELLSRYPERIVAVDATRSPENVFDEITDKIGEKL
jgi:thymidylate kinase